MLLLWFERGNDFTDSFWELHHLLVLLTDAIVSWEQWVKQLNADITELDPEISDIIEHEKNRQWKVWGILINVCIGPILFLLMLSLLILRMFLESGTCLK